MPFGCLALREGRSYNHISDVTDKYEFGQVLRAKEFCELCLVKERQTDKVFVCKKFLKKDGRKVRKAAKNEIMILKLVNHPNILQLIDTYETRKEYFIIQELATGGDVFDWILDQGNYTERDASNVIRQVLEAVAYLHSLNIVHRNLKLENLMYYTENNHNKVVLRDFYLSRFENGPITEPCGTPEYLAPEVVARHRYGRPVDCWAVGVIMYILLSGNPPFYDETEEENTDLHNRIIFCRIVAGEFEFDSPYWDDISPAAKELVCRLMEVDQMLRITAQDALWHEWIAGNGASEKNLKDGVCAQFEKNFAKAKWRELKKAIRVTTFMQRLKNSEALTDSSAEVQAGEESQRTSEEGDKGMSDGGVTSSSVSLEVTVENSPMGLEYEAIGDKITASIGPTLGISPSELKGPPCQQNQSDGTPQTAQDKMVYDSKIKTVPTSQNGVRVSERFDVNVDKQHVSHSSDLANKCKMATTFTSTGLNPVAVTLTPEKKSSAQRDDHSGNWCQTQVPEAVAERSVAPIPPMTGLEEVRLRGEISPLVRREREARKADRYSAEFNVSRTGPTSGPGCYSIGSTASLGRHATPYKPEIGSVGMEMTSFGNPYSSSLYTSGAGIGMYGTGLPHTSDWQMDSVIEQIEKQMAAVLEKIEGDMPSLLEQISDCPPEPARMARSAHASPATCRAPPPLPSSPRPAQPPQPRLTIPPPSYPPPSPPTQSTAPAHEPEDGQRGTVNSSQSPRAGTSRGN